MAESTKTYEVLVDSLGYLVQSDNDRWVPARGVRGAEVELDERQAERFINLGAVRPRGDDPVEGPLTAGQVAAFNVSQIAGYVDEHPGSRESVIALEKKGRNRPGVLQVLENPGHLPPDIDETGETIDERLSQALSDAERDEGTEEEESRAKDEELKELGAKRKGNSSWYELPDGNSVQGRDQALQAARELRASGGANSATGSKGRDDG